MQQRQSSPSHAVAALVGVVILLLVTLVSTMPAAEAQVSCDNPQRVWDAATADEFNAALDCHNAGGGAGAFEFGCRPTGDIYWEVATERDFEAAIECANGPSPSGRELWLSLQNDIEATTVHGSSVFPPVTPPGNIRFTLSGNGYSLRRSSAAPQTAADLLSFTGLGSIDVDLNGLGLIVGQADLSAVSHDGTGTLAFFGSSITPGPAGTSAIGLFSSASPGWDIKVENSKIDGVRIAVSTGIGGATQIVSSSLVASEDALEVSDGTTEIVNSTLVAPVALELFSPGSVAVTNSTLIGDGGLISEPEFGGSISYRSSIVTSCSADVIDQGNNVGDCFAAGAVVDISLADNGCVRGTPTGCPRSVALSPTASARGQGNCADFLGTAITTDQRSFARTPSGTTGCDAGAFESNGCEANGQRNFDVANQAQFDAAIVCFNSVGSGPGDYSITLTADIIGTPEREFRLATFETIERGANDATLTIDGAGFNLADTGDIEAISLIAIGSFNAAPVSFKNMLFDPERRLDFTLRTGGSGPIDIRDSAFVGAPGLRSDSAIVGDTAPLSVENSIFYADRSGIQVNNTELTVTNSSFFSLYSLEVDGGTTFDVTNSTLDGSIIAKLANGPAIGTVRNSTVTGAISVWSSEGPGASTEVSIDVSSSLIWDLCDDRVTDDGYNLGGCWNPGIQLPPPSFADNGCARETPVGCPPTVEITAGHPAMYSGNCQGLPTDQRGVVRTPPGIGCEAGAYESPQAPLPGDVDFSFEVNNLDVQWLLDWLAGGTEPALLPAGDLTGDGVINLADALAIAQQVAGG